MLYENYKREKPILVLFGFSMFLGNKFWNYQMDIKDYTFKIFFFFLLKKQNIFLFFAQTAELDELY